MPRVQEQITPIGTIIAFGGSVVPNGYLLCNGLSLSRITYAPLFAAIGTSWGAPDGSHFNLPDLMGRFTRHRDGGIGRDPDRASRSVCNSGGNAGDNVGSIQGQATRVNGLYNNAVGFSVNTDYPGDHVHTYPLYSYGASLLEIYGDPDGVTIAYPNDPVYGLISYWSNAGAHSHGVGSGSTSPMSITGDLETRPINANVLYVIKY